MLLAHELAGDEVARPVVLIHGITENRNTWRPVIDALGADHRVLAVDLRGHGDSARGDAYDPLTYACDVAETVAAAGIVDPLVVGHSLGGLVATAYASAATACAIVNVDQPLHLAGFKVGLSMLEPMLKGTPDQFRDAIAIVFGQLYGPLPPDELARVQAIEHPDQDVVLGTWKAVFESNTDELDAVVASLTAPVRVPYLSLHGIDPGPDYTTWVHTHIPQATVEVWPDHGHYPFLVDLRRFLARLTTFEREVAR